MRWLGDTKVSTVQYHGEAEVTKHCLDAVVRLIHSDQRIESARLLTFEGRHAFLLRLHDGQKIVVKAGFSSGYSGEGPAALASALQLMRRHGVEIEEVDVSHRLLDRLDGNSLADSDIAQIEKCDGIRPVRLYDYIYDAHKMERATEVSLWRSYPSVLPMRIIDQRIIDLALKLESDPDSALMTGYRRLERIVADRCGLTGAAGQKIFSTAFQGATPLLTWVGLEPAEAGGRAQLFTGCYMAFRNRRAHKEIDQSKDQAIREFLLLNELFLLEADAV